MITPAQRAEIRRLYYGEHWKLGTIAAQLGLHRETVRAAVEGESVGVRRGACRPSALDPYLPFIRDTLAQYPTLRATRIHEMVRQRGYPGSVIQVRRLVGRLRPETARTVYRRVVTLSGEQAQVDWGSFGKVRIGRGDRAVSGFVMVLGHSRAIAALFTLDQTLESFLRGHVEAFKALGGVARTLVYDNLRTAVLDRRGAAVQFHPRLLELAGHYHFAPQPCTPGRGNEKSQASYYAPSCTCDTSSGYCRRSRNRFPGWAVGSGPVGGSKSIVPSVVGAHGAQHALVCEALGGGRVHVEQLGHLRSGQPARPAQVLGVAVDVVRLAQHADAQAAEWQTGPGA